MKSFGNITDPNSFVKIFFSVEEIIKKVDSNQLHKYAKPIKWNDPDMLEVGVKGLSLEESKTHFSMWAMMAAPLIAGNDIRNISPQIKF